MDLRFSLGPRLLFLICFLLIFSTLACEDERCTPGTTQECHCPDGNSGVQRCLPDGAGWDECEGCTSYSVWCDDQTGLCWQDPQKDAYNKENNGVTSYDAVRYCEDLVLGGYDDWRLPTIDELRSIIKGNSATEIGPSSLCAITEGSLMNDQGPLQFGISQLLPCMGKMTKQLSGPDESGCFWKEPLSGNCDRTDPASPSHNLEFWSSTVAADDPEWVAYVFFDFAAVGFNHAESYAEVRCVRDAPTEIVIGANEVGCVPGESRKCRSANGENGSQVCYQIDTTTTGWGPCDYSKFEPSPKPVDVSDECDQITVKVDLSETLEQQPYLLSVYLYKKGEVFMRPPDVGTFENAIFYPDINKGKPITTVIPGCSYYKDRCMSGDYYLVVYLKMNEGIFPGMPDLVDMVWVNFDTISLSEDGSQELYFEVEAVPMLQSPYYMLFVW